MIEPTPDKQIPAGSWVVIALAGLACSACIGFIGSFGYAPAVSVDMGFHLQIVEVFKHHLTLPANAETYMREMVLYPHWSHRLAAIPARLGVSGLNALNLTAMASAAWIWMLLFAVARVAGPTTFLACVLSAALAAFVTGATFGGEIIVNYFYPQLVSEAVAITLLILAVALLARSRLAYCGFALAAVCVCSQFHLVGTLHLAGGLCVLIGAVVAKDLVTKSGAASLVWLLLVPAIGAAVVFNPPFRLMRRLSVANGGIIFDAPLSIHMIEAAAVLLLVLGTSLAAMLVGRASRQNAPTSRWWAMIVLAALGMSCAATFLAQDAAYALLHEGSEYAVKKQAFGVVTCLAFVLPTLVFAWPGSGRRDWRGRNLAFLACSLVVGGMIVALRFRHPGLPPLTSPMAYARAGMGLVALAAPLVIWLASDRRWSEKHAGVAAACLSILMAQLVVMQILFFRPSLLDVPRISNILENAASFRPADQGGGFDYLFVSARSPQIVGFLANMAALRVDRQLNANIASTLLAGDVMYPDRAPFLVTEVGDETYDVIRCRRGPPRGPVVMVDGACVSGITYSFRAGGAATRFLREGWSIPEAGGVWSTGKRAVIELALPPGIEQARQPRLLLNTFGFIPTESPRRSVHLAIEGEPAQTYVFDRNNSGDNIFRLDLPPSTVARRSARIVFTIDEPVAADPSVTAPDRLLGVGVSDVILYPGPHRWTAGSQPRPPAGRP